MGTESPFPWTSVKGDCWVPLSTLLWGRAGPHLGQLSVPGSEHEPASPPLAATCAARHQAGLEVASSACLQLVVTLNGSSHALCHLCVKQAHHAGLRPLLHLQPQGARGALFAGLPAEGPAQSRQEGRWRPQAGRPLPSLQAEGGHLQALGLHLPAQGPARPQASCPCT